MKPPKIDSEVSQHDLFRSKLKQIIDLRHPLVKLAESINWSMKRRAAVEPGIGHLKHGHRMDRNRLKGIEGDMFNAISSAAGMNFSKLGEKLLDFLRPFVVGLMERIFVGLRGGSCLPPSVCYI